MASVQRGDISGPCDSASWHGKHIAGLLRRKAPGDGFVHRVRRAVTACELVRTAHLPGRSLVVLLMTHIMTIRFMSRWKRRIENGQMSVNGAVMRDPEFVVRWAQAEGVTCTQSVLPTIWEMMP